MTIANAPTTVDETAPDETAAPAPAPAYVTKEQLQELLKANTDALLARLAPPPKEPDAAATGDALTELARVRTDMDQLREENKREKQVNTLLKAGMHDERYLPSILAAYDGREDFAAFSVRIAKDKAYQGFFGTTAPVGKPPETPGTGRTPPAGREITPDAQLKADAEKFYPGDEAMQKRFMKNRKAVEANR